MTTLVTNLANRCMSSQLPDIVWETTAASLTIGLWDANGDTRFVEVSLTAVDGSVRLWDVREAVERRMRTQNEQRMNMMVQWKEPSASNWTSQAVAIHFCDAEFTGNAATWMTSHFLTTQSWKPLPLDERTEVLSFYHPTTGVDVSAEWMAVCRHDNGTVQAYELPGQEEVLSVDQVQTFEWTLAQLQALADTAAGETVEVLAVAIRVGQRVMNYYRSLLPNLVMGFRNCFNVPEWAALNCATKRKIKDERKKAMVGRQMTLYDTHRDVEYEVETAPLAMAHALWLDQLLTTHSAWLPDGTPVVITDGTMEASDDNAVMNICKFTWRRASGRAHIVVEQRDDGIFTDEFSYQFD